ncbi:hypothetical protein [Metabacillus iocasae]|uniref:Lipoprotein n=1 Tax=Priestia iocasae TaxID=2291674 RepID=A0ABS2QU67_9BACI|nr:hypothetical protein [Metabacillus iocasae]MBM7702462.1 hypothetical protein [Metabacillus iocasae]
MIRMKVAVAMGLSVMMLTACTQEQETQEVSAAAPQAAQLLQQEQKVGQFYEYQQDKSNKQLEGLAPYDVFLLYWAAVKEDDHKTMYALYAKGEEAGTPSYDVFKSEYVEYKENTLNILEEIESRGIYSFEQVMVSDDRAYISLDEEIGLGFGLTKQDDVWKVNWMPVQ